MTDEQINVAIAADLGWKYDPRGDKYGPTVYAWLNPAGKRDPGPPSYASDLNAMHEAEDALRICKSGGSDCEWQRYWSALDVGPAGCVGRKMLLHITARQRAEAFLRVKGKWVE